MQINNKFPKEERLCGSKTTELLFSQGDRSIGSFPVRLVWLAIPYDPQRGYVQLLVSAPKRHLHEAVKRNRVKRQIREFYRKNNKSLKELMAVHEKTLLLAVLYSDRNLWDSPRLDQRLSAALSKLQSRLESEFNQTES